MPVISALPKKTGGKKIEGDYGGSLIRFPSCRFPTDDAIPRERNVLLVRRDTAEGRFLPFHPAAGRDCHLLSAFLFAQLYVAAYCSIRCGSNARGIELRFSFAAHKKTKRTNKVTFSRAKCVPATAAAKQTRRNAANCVANCVANLP